MTQEEFDNLKAGDRISNFHYGDATFITTDGDEAIIRWAASGAISNYNVRDFMSEWACRQPPPSEPAPFPQIGDTWWRLGSNGEPREFKWEGWKFHLVLLELGLIFPTKEAAELHAKWLASDAAKEAKAKWPEGLEKPWEKFKGWKPSDKHGIYWISQPGKDSNWAINPGIFYGHVGDMVLLDENRMFPLTEEGRAAAEARLKNLQEAK